MYLNKYHLRFGFKWEVRVSIKTLLLKGAFLIALAAKFTTMTWPDARKWRRPRVKLKMRQTMKAKTKCLRPQGFVACPKATKWQVKRNRKAARQARREPQVTLIAVTSPFIMTMQQSLEDGTTPQLQPSNSNNATATMNDSPPILEQKT